MIRENVALWDSVDTQMSDNRYFILGAGEASADVPEGEDDKTKDDDTVAEGKDFLDKI